MGSRGPLPDPDSSESRRGRNTLVRRKPTATKTSVEAPDFIRDNPAAMLFWERHAPALVAAGRLHGLQALTFAVIAEQFAEVRALTAAVQADGLVIDGPRGQQANPALRALRDARRDLLAAARGFGLDALSDARLPAEPAPAQMSVIDRFRAMKDLRTVTAADADLTAEQREILLHGDGDERAAVIAAVREDRLMFQ